MDETESKTKTFKAGWPLRRKLVLAVCGLIVFAVACLAIKYGYMVSSSVGNTERDTSTYAEASVEWAEKLDVPALPNLHKVSDTLYRGAQPSEEGIETLAKMGVKTIVNLRLLHSDRKKAEQLGLNYEHIRVETWDPDSPEVVRFLKVVADPNLAPVFVHCKHGADRTGTMCAIYRVLFQGWTKEQAISEMTKGGFNFHSTWQNLVKYVNNLDVEEIKRRAGLTVE